MNEDSFLELATKLNGIIFRKALLENDMEKVYEKVFRKISRSLEKDLHILQIFGDVGG